VWFLIKRRENFTFTSTADIGVRTGKAHIVTKLAESEFKTRKRIHPPQMGDVDIAVWKYILEDETKHDKIVKE
jgi:hypothetical protein